MVGGALLQRDNLDEAMRLLPMHQLGLSRRRMVATTTASSRDVAVPSRWWPSALFGMPTMTLPAASTVRSPPAVDQRRYRIQRKYRGSVRWH